MNIIITGYYNKNNLGDDLFESYAKQLFTIKNINKHIKSYKILPIMELNKLQNVNNNDNYIDNYDNINNINCVILFGGETLNNYFLDELIKFYESCKSNKIKFIFKAIGVSCNQEYSVNLINKIQLFETIIFRSMKDYNFFKEVYLLKNYYFFENFLFNKYLNLKYKKSILKKYKKIS